MARPDVAFILLALLALTITQVLASRHDKRSAITNDNAGHGVTAAGDVLDNSVSHAAQSHQGDKHASEHTMKASKKPSGRLSFSMSLVGGDGGAKKGSRPQQMPRPRPQVAAPGASAMPRPPISWQNQDQGGKTWLQGSSWPSSEHNPSDQDLDRNGNQIPHWLPDYLKEYQRSGYMPENPSSQDYAEKDEFPRTLEEFMEREMANGVPTWLPPDLQTYMREKYMLTELVNLNALFWQTLLDNDSEASQRFWPKLLDVPGVPPGKSQSSGSKAQAKLVMTFLRAKMTAADDIRVGRFFLNLVERTFVESKSCLRCEKPCYERCMFGQVKLYTPTKAESVECCASVQESVLAMKKVQEQLTDAKIEMRSLGRALVAAAQAEREIDLDIKAANGDEAAQLEKLDKAVKVFELQDTVKKDYKLAKAVLIGAGVGAALVPASAATVALGLGAACAAAVQDALGDAKEVLRREALEMSLVHSDTKATFDIAEARMQRQALRDKIERIEASIATSSCTVQAAEKLMQKAVDEAEVQLIQTNRLLFGRSSVEASGMA